MATAGDGKPAFGGNGRSAPTKVARSVQRRKGMRMAHDGYSGIMYLHKHVAYAETLIFILFGLDNGDHLIFHK